jgi:hypothetical protein
MAGWAARPADRLRGILPLAATNDPSYRRMSARVVNFRSLSSFRLATMTARFVIASSALALVATCAAATAQEPKLQSREYKLMLDPKRFDRLAPQRVVDQLWTTKLAGIIATHLDKRSDGGTRAKGLFDKTKQRKVVFRDTNETCLLDRQGYIFREHTRLKDGKPDREVTLKFRSPDIFLAAARMPATGDSKFEEDITPVVIVSSGKPAVARFATPPSMRSLFSASETRDVPADVRLTTLADVVRVFPELGTRLETAAVAPSEAVRPGRAFNEMVISGGTVDLGSSLDAEFDVTLWYDGLPGRGKPETAELSFKYDVKNGRVSGEAAARALRLFTALQSDLADWTSPDRETKTSVGLSTVCKKG